MSWKCHNAKSAPTNNPPPCEPCKTPTNFSDSTGQPHCHYHCWSTEGREGWLKTTEALARGVRGVLITGWVCNLALCNPASVVAAKDSPALPEELP